MLKSALVSAGVSARVEFANIEFAKTVGLFPYQQIALGHPTPHDLVGEWIFSRQCLGGSAENYLGYRRLVLEGQHPAHKIAKPLDKEFLCNVSMMRRKAGAFVRLAAKKIISMRPRIVGFSTVYQQTLAALSIAKEIKSIEPSIVTVFGGANCESEMGLELLKSFKQIDIVVCGEAEQVFPKLVDQVLTFGQYQHLLPNVHTREFKSTSSSSVLADLDLLPIPDFTEFKEAVDTLLVADDQIQIPFETSRGCWWGEKHHCIFCGLNGSSMHYRKKTPHRVRVELERLEKDFPNARLIAVDNIVDISLLPEIASPTRTNPLFFEAKSNLRRQDFEAMQRAKVDEIQIGVESLSTACLKLLKKGVSALQNIQSLKWACEFGLTVYWNLLVDVPHADDIEYQKQRELIPLITHLSPPSCLNYIRVDRFSPLFQENTERVPYPAYRFVFGQSDQSVSRLAYFFTSENSGKWISETTCNELQDAIETWRSVWPRSLLVMVENGAEESVVLDTRNPSGSRMILINAAELGILRACDRIISFALLQQIVQSNDLALSASISKLLAAGLIIRENDLLLSVVPLTSEHYPGTGIFAPNRDQPRLQTNVN